MATKSIVATLELGHRAVVKHQKTSEGFTHDWEVFVQGVGGAQIEHFVEKVVFYLHESFNNPQRVIKSPPFLVREKGYGGFILPIEVYFKAIDEHHRKTKITYDLFLQSVDNAPISHTIKDKITFFKPKEEFRKLLLLGGAIEETIPENSKKSSQSSVSRPASGGKTKPRHDSNASSKAEQGDGNARKSKNVTGKHTTQRKEKTKDASRMKESSQKQSSKAKEPYVRVKDEPLKQKHREHLPKQSDRTKSTPTKQKDQIKPKQTKAPDTFSELFGEPIRKVTQSVNPKKAEKKQQKDMIEEQVTTGVNMAKSGKSKPRQKCKDTFKKTDFYKGHTEKEENQAQSKPKASKKPPKVKVSETTFKPEEMKEISTVVPDKSKLQKVTKERTPVKQVEPPPKNSNKQKKRQKKKTDYLPEPKNERKVPATPPTPLKQPSPPKRRHPSPESSSSGSRSRSPSRSSEDSSRSRPRSHSSNSRQVSLSQSRSSCSEKSHSRSPSVRSHETLSKSPSVSRSHSDSAMSRSTSSSSCRSSLSVGPAEGSLSVDHPVTGASGGPLGVLIQDIEGSSTDSDDEKGFPSSEEETLPSLAKKSYSKRRTSEMSSLPSSRHSSCHSGKGAFSSSENENVLKKRNAKERKRKKKLALKAKRREERAAAGIPSTPSAKCDTDKSDSEMVQAPEEKVKEDAHRENVQLLERIRKLAINEEYDKLQDIMKIVGRKHPMKNGCLAIDYYKLSKIAQIRLKNYIDRLDHPE